MKLEIVATRPLRYGTRALAAGQAFEATSRDAKILVGAGKARYPEPPPPPPTADQMAELREEYERVVGKRPFMGWSADELRAALPPTAVLEVLPFDRPRLAGWATETR